MTRPHLLPHLLHDAAEHRPGATALELGDRRVDYRELAATAERLAACFAAGGVGHGDRVGVHLPKGLVAYAAVFGALGVGGCYVPLDPSAPPARIRTMAEDCGLAGLVTTGELARRLFATGELPGLRRVVIDGNAGTSLDGFPAVSWQEAVAAGSAPPPNPAIETDLAYLLYTSGSTGRPKGVMISHRGALAFVQWAVAELGLEASDRVAAVAALHFDLSVFDLFATIAAGATLLPLPPGILLRPRELTRWIAEAGITVWYSTPSTWILLLEEGGLEERRYPRLRRVLFAGEVFPTRQLRRLRRALPDAELYNLYGPTETNVCTWKRVDELPADDRRTVAIGRAIDGVEVVAVDPEGREVPPGAEGELLVRGPTVTSGYWGGPEGSAAAFTSLPHHPGDGRWYRTGDLVHRDPDGDYHFHGRRDHMVKVRGYRVELGEVEAHLSAHPEVREVAVVVPEDDPVEGGGDEDGRGDRLCAAVVAAGPERPSVIGLKTFLGERLPPYMIPTEIRFVDALPKTSTKKIDRRTLARELGRRNEERK